MTAFWDIALCSLFGVDRRFRGEYCLHHQGDYGGSKNEFITLMMAAVRISETSVYSNATTRRCIPEGCLSSSELRKSLGTHTNVQLGL
jgi:hypothetical protein